MDRHSAQQQIGRWLGALKDVDLVDSLGVEHALELAFIQGIRATLMCSTVAREVYLSSGINRELAQDFVEDILRGTIDGLTDEEVEEHLAEILATDPVLPYFSARLDPDVNEN